MLSSWLNDMDEAEGERLREIAEYSSTSLTKCFPLS